MVGAEPLESTEPWLPLMQSETKTGNAFCAAVDRIKQKMHALQGVLETAGAAAPVVEAAEGFHDRPSHAEADL